MPDVQVCGMNLLARQRRSQPSEGCIATITSAKRGAQPTEQRGGSIEGVNLIMCQRGCQELEGQKVL